jgi:hypothetical protein
MGALLRNCLDTIIEVAGTTRAQSTEYPFDPDTDMTVEGGKATQHPSESVDAEERRIGAAMNRFTTVLIIGVNLEEGGGGEIKPNSNNLPNIHK